MKTFRTNFLTYAAAHEPDFVREMLRPWEPLDIRVCYLCLLTFSVVPLTRTIKYTCECVISTLKLIPPESYNELARACLHRRTHEFVCYKTARHCCTLSSL